MIEKILRESIEKIRTLSALPDKGYLAGGSLATTCWNILYEQNVAINDIDIFEFSPIDDSGEGKKIKTEEYSIGEDIYGDIFLSTDEKIVYKICQVENKDLLNIIQYQSNTDTLEGLISRFDINYTQVGYDLEKDRFFWTKNFEEFLFNKRLYVSEIITPAKTLSRIFKKSKEFSIPIEKCEIDILNMALNFSPDKINKANRERFEKYVENLSQYKIQQIVVNNPNRIERYRNNLFEIRFKPLHKFNSCVIVRKNLLKYREYKDNLTPFKFLCILPLLNDTPKFEDMNKELVESAYQIASCSNDFYSSSHKWIHLLGKKYKEIEQEFLLLKDKYTLNEIGFLWSHTRPEKNISKISEIEYYAMNS